jgi:AraC-like DNA-binding protein
MLIIRLFRGLSTQFITIPHPVEKPVWGHYKIPELAAQLIKYPHQNNQLAELMKLVTHVTSDATAKLFPVNERQVDNLFYVREQMKQALQKKTGLKTWASQAQMNLTTFKYLFSQVFGVTPYNYLLEIRLEASKKMAAEEPYLSLKTVAERCGFNTYDNLRRTFYAKEKMTFTAWRKLKGLLQMLITSEILDACWL